MSNTNVKPAETNITPAMNAAFQLLTSGQVPNFCLVSCYVNGEPASAICYAEHDKSAGFDAIAMTPLFVAVTPGMKLQDHSGLPTMSAAEAAEHRKNGGTFGSFGDGLADASVVGHA